MEKLKDLLVDVASVTLLTLVMLSITLVAGLWFMFMLAVLVWPFFGFGYEYWPVWAGIPAVFLSMLFGALVAASVYFNGNRY